MGIEFAKNVDGQRAQAGKFVQATKAGIPFLEFNVAPEGMDDEDVSAEAVEPPSRIEDPLLNLFRRGAEFTGESFREELRAQRRAGQNGQATSAGA